MCVCVCVCVCVCLHLEWSWAPGQEIKSRFWSANLDIFLRQSISELCLWNSVWVIGDNMSQRGKYLQASEWSWSGARRRQSRRRDGATTGKNAPVSAFFFRGQISEQSFETRWRFRGEHRLFLDFFTRSRREMLGPKRGIETGRFPKTVPSRSSSSSSDSENLCYLSSSLLSLGARNEAMLSNTDSRPLAFLFFLIQLFAQLVPLFLAAHTQSIFNDDQHHLAAVQKLWGNLSISDGIFPGWKCLRLDSKRFVTNRETCSEILFDEIEMLTIYGAAGESNQLAGAQNLSLLLLLLRLLLHGVSENNDRFFGNWGLKLLKWAGWHLNHLQLSWKKRDTWRHTRPTCSKSTIENAIHFPPFSTGSNRI